MTVRKAEDHHGLKKAELQPLFAEVKHLLGGFRATLEIKYVERANNRGVDKARQHGAGRAG